MLEASGGRRSVESSHPKALLACSHPQTLRTLLSMLWQCGVKPIAASSVRGVRAASAYYPVALVFCEDHLPGGGFETVLQIPRLRECGARVVVCSRSGEVETYLAAMDRGVFDFLCPPFRLPDIQAILDRLGKGRNPARLSAAPEEQYRRARA